MRRISLGLAFLGLTLSFSAYAAFPNDANPFQVVVPNLAPGFEFSVTGLLLQPTSDDENYAVVMNDIESTFQTPNIKTVTPGFDWAFALGLGYIFPCSGNDIRAAWEHFNGQTTDSMAINGRAIQRLTPLSSILIENFDDSSKASGTEDFKYDAVDLDAGQFVDIGTHLEVRLFAGVRYVHIDRDFNTNFQNLEDFDIDSFTTDSSSRFDGAGPLVGVDSSYQLTNCIGLVGHFAAAALVGRVTTDASISIPNSAFGLLPNQFITNLDTDNETRVVPGIDAKLGLDFSYPFNCNTSVFSVELGYQVVHYVDAVDNLTPVSTSTPVFTTPVTVGGIERVTSDVGFNGPYLSLNLKV